MTMQLLPILISYARFEEPANHDAISRNLARISIWGVLASGSTASVSFIFSRFLMQEGSCKALASHVFKASLTSWGTFAAVGAYCIYNIVLISRAYHPDFAKTLNERVSLVAKYSALVGLIGAGAAFASQFITSNTLVSSVAKHTFDLLLGLGTTSSVLGIYHHWQNKELAQWQ
jgi:hypothetical protein